MAVLDPQRIAAAAARMRRPELRLHPSDIGRFHAAVGPSRLLTDRDRAFAEMASLAPAHGIAVVADATVEIGHMWLVDAEPEPLEFVVPKLFASDALAWIDRLSGSVEKER